MNTYTTEKIVVSDPTCIIEVLLFLHYLNIPVTNFSRSVLISLLPSRRGLQFPMCPRLEKLFTDMSGSSGAPNIHVLPQFCNNLLVVWSANGDCSALTS